MTDQTQLRPRQGAKPASRQGSTSSVVLSELRQGERTTSELMTAASVSRNAVLCCIAGLRGACYQITDAQAARGQRRRGGHHDGLWRLAFDVERPAPRICALPGCTTPLNRYNANRYCLIHRHYVAALLVSWSTGILRQEVTSVEHLLALIEPAPPEVGY